MSKVRAKKDDDSEESKNDRWMNKMRGRKNREISERGKMRQREHPEWIKDEKQKL